MRGEQIASVAEWVTPVGSSPHARGTDVVDLRRALIVGIIPACAGNSPSDARDVITGGGSSPNARGTDSLPGAGRGGEGIIPACAGNRVDAKRQVRPAQDHPRMRGEQDGKQRR